MYERYTKDFARMVIGLQLYRLDMCVCRFVEVRWALSISLRLAYDNKHAHATKQKTRNVLFKSSIFIIDHVSLRSVLSYNLQSFNNICILH